MCGPFFVPHVADMPSHTPAESWQQQNGSRNARRCCFFLTFRGRRTNRPERGGFFTNKNQTFQQREVFYLAKSKIPSSFGVWYHPVESRWCFPTRTSENMFIKKKTLWIFAGTSGCSKKNREVTHRILDDFFSWPVSLSVGDSTTSSVLPPFNVDWSAHSYGKGLLWVSYMCPKKGWIAKRAARDSLEKLSQEGQWLEIGVILARATRKWAIKKGPLISWLIKDSTSS